MSLQFEESKEPLIKTEPEVGGDDNFDDEEDDDDEEMRSNEMCLEAKEVVQYTSDESSSDDDDFGEDIEDSDYGSRKGIIEESNLQARMTYATFQGKKFNLRTVHPNTEVFLCGLWLCRKGKLRKGYLNPKRKLG